MSGTFPHKFCVGMSLSNLFLNLTQKFKEVKWVPFNFYPFFGKISKLHNQYPFVDFTLQITASCAIYAFMP